MLVLRNLSYIHPDKDLLFNNINLSIARHEKAALVGNNGAGKSTLLQILAGNLIPSSGSVDTLAKPYYIPQLFGQFNACTVAQALGIQDKLKALSEILNGEVTEDNLTALNDDWTIEERCMEALAHWRLDGIELTQKLSTLSGGQKTKVFLAGITIHSPEVILLDEPSNHLDVEGRQLLYEFIQSTSSTLLVVSHDRKLLNLLNVVYELTNSGITVFGGNYDFYAEQKKMGGQALEADIRNKEKELRRAKELERETAERKQKLDARGKSKQEKAGIPTIMLNTLRNKAERSTSRLKGVHEEKIGAISHELADLRKALPDMDKMKLRFQKSALHQGKVLITALGLNFSYAHDFLWAEDLSFEIRSGERIALRGKNGSGKSTLIKGILSEIHPARGVVKKADNTSAVYIDQDYSLLNNELTVYEQACCYNHTGLQEHEIKTRLTRFLFTREVWDKPCFTLSGGQKMRLILCCLTIGEQSPDMIILDEPTNNLDIQNLEILTNSVSDYEGTILVVSHDEYFLEQIKVTRTIELEAIPDERPS